MKSVVALRDLERTVFYDNVLGIYESKWLLVCCVLVCLCFVSVSVHPCVCVCVKKHNIYIYIY